MKFLIPKYLKALQKMSNNKHIDFYTENDTINQLCHLIWCRIRQDFKPSNAVILNVSPDYSSIFAMRLAHYMSDGGEMMEMVNVDVPYPDELDMIYKQEFFLTLRHLKNQYKKFILCEAAVLTGKNYTWMVEMMLAEGIAKENIITTALFQRHDAIFKTDYVGQSFLEEMIEFHWERYNKHWDERNTKKD